MATEELQTTLETPPPYAGFWVRLVADVLDSLLLTGAAWVIQVGVLRVFHLFLCLYQKNNGESMVPFDNAFNPFFVQVLNVGIYFCIAFPYFIYGHLKWGTTLGKKPLSIYVVDAETLGPISLKQSMIRFFAYGLSYLPLCAGFTMAAFHPRKQTLHELLAQTVSVFRPTR